MTTPSYLQNVNENILLWLLGAANIFQDDGVVDAFGIWLVQVVCVWLVPLLEGEEDLVLICAHYLNILENETEKLVLLGVKQEKRSVKEGNWIKRIKGME